MTKEEFMMWSNGYDYSNPKDVAEFKKELEAENRYDEIMASAVGMFIAQCGEMAEENWLPSQVDMLERLFGAVLKGCKYDEWVKEQSCTKYTKK